MTGIDLSLFATEVGEFGPVSVAGLSTRGGGVEGVRTVVAPSGIAWYNPEEMTVCCGASTPISELRARLSEAGQFVALPDFGTVGGALATASNSLFRLRHGPIRDSVLQIRLVTAQGEVAQAGGPTVKNVSGFDLCRLLVGSHGTLGFIGEVILRTRPSLGAVRWFTGTDDPFVIRRSLYRPSSVLWDGKTTWVALEGHACDVESEASRVRLEPVVGPPTFPPISSCVSPSDLRSVTSRMAPTSFVAELGTGIVHSSVLLARPCIDASVVTLQQRIKTTFDPEGRLNPGRGPWEVR